MRVWRRCATVAPMTEKDKCLAGDIWPYLDDVGVDMLERYFATGDTDSGLAFSGAAFEAFAGGGDAATVANAFTADDMVAVSFLGVNVPGHAAIAILDRRADDMNQLLSQIPTDVDLWAASVDMVSAGSPASQLWTELRSLHKMGLVTTSKLLARKRPRLIPVYDSVVNLALGMGHRATWLPLRIELQEESIRARLAEMRTAARVNESVSLLRILDVAIWMRNRRESEHKLPFKECPRY